MAGKAHITPKRKRETSTLLEDWNAFVVVVSLLGGHQNKLFLFLRECTHVYAQRSLPAAVYTRNKSQSEGRKTQGDMD